MMSFLRGEHLRVVPSSFLVSTLIFTLLATARAQTSSSQRPQPQKTAAHNTWAPALETGLGITQQSFRDMGLEALTRKQYTNLLEWIHTREPQSSRDVPSRISWTPEVEQQFDMTNQNFQDMGLSALSPEQYINLLAWDETRTQKARNSVITENFDCGRTSEFFADSKPEAYDKVRVYIDATGEASEVISGVRERFRAMNGIEVVYDNTEADVTVSLVALNLETTGGYHNGVAISYVVQKPCILKFGTSKTNYDTIENQGLQVGSNISGVVDSIVSKIDTSDLEKHRQSNASYKKILQSRVKK
jgi:hypothetical protein